MLQRRWRNVMWAIEELDQAEVLPPGLWRANGVADHR